MPALQMLPVKDEILAQTRGGRGHGEYDGFLAEFATAVDKDGNPLRGTEVGFEGVQATSIKASLKSAIKRAGLEGQIEVRGKTLEDGEHVYLVRSAPEIA